MRTKNIKSTIKDYFFQNPTKKLRVRQIERELELSLPSVIRYVKELEKEGLIKKEQTAGISLFSADRDSEKYKLEKKHYNIMQLYKTGLVKYIIDELSNPPIIAFGSYSKGEDTEQSDIDIYIETPSKKELDLKKYEKALKRSIQIFKNKKLNALANPHLANNIINGVKLNGYIEVYE